MAGQTNQKKYAKSEYKSARISPRKASLVANVVRGVDVKVALKELTFLNKKAAGIIYNVVKSAAANAQNNHGMVKDKLVVDDIRIGPGITIKKRRIEAKGRFKPILKRTSNITVILKEKGDSIEQKS